MSSCFDFRVVVAHRYSDHGHHLSVETVSYQASREQHMVRMSVKLKEQCVADESQPGCSRSSMCAHLLQSDSSCRLGMTRSLERVFKTKSSSIVLEGSRNLDLEPRPLST